ncbi:hypothetical protein [Verrucomicrobium sp. BvORR034]|jgi:hypothetical protein|uniref:hypothetical protein n=1 Tax=Verrucomicrobium sp. BvORR034 TaxID=1396418 RepID=UPI00067872BF|nr:hypothetical protein [Verrucomicrobium sp. BvORR034]
MSSRTLLVTLLALVAIWGAVAAVMNATDKHTSTPEKVLNLMAGASWLQEGASDLSEAERRKQMEATIAQMNLLDFDQRRQMREDGQDVSDRYFNSLSKEEKSYFLEQTVEQHFKSVMKAFNAMSPEDRRKAVERARADMKRNQGDQRGMERMQKEDAQAFEKMVEKGMGAYYEEASAETKMDLAPLLEEMQQRLRSMPGR